MSNEQLEVLKAVIGTFGTIAVAGFVFLGVLVQSRKPSKTKPPVGDTGKALEEFNGTQNEFMALVIADNKDLRNQMSDLKKMVEEIKTHQERFIDAVRRYLTKLAHHWSGSDPFPLPDEEDFHILEDALPNRKRKIYKEKP